MNMTFLADALILWLCILLCAIWFVFKLVGIDLLEPCKYNNRCSIQAIEQHAAITGDNPPTCEQYSKVDGRVC
jgi:hypothetical protein